MGEFAYGCSLSYAVDADNHDDVWLLSGRGHEASCCVVGVVFGEHVADFLTQEVVELVHVDIFVACHALLDAVDYF